MEIGDVVRLKGVEGGRLMTVGAFPDEMSNGYACLWFDEHRHLNKSYVAEEGLEVVTPRKVWAVAEEAKRAS